MSSKKACSESWGSPGRPNTSMQAFESTSMSASAVRVAPLLPMTLFVTAMTSHPASAASITAREPAPSVPMTRTSHVNSTVSIAIQKPLSRADLDELASRPGEELRTPLAHNKVLFRDEGAQLLVDPARLDREGHPLAEDRLVIGRDVGRLGAHEADPVTDSSGRERELHTAFGRVGVEARHDLGWRAAGQTLLHRVPGGLAYPVPVVARAGARAPEHRGPAMVGPVPAVDDTEIAPEHVARLQ